MSNPWLNSPSELAIAPLKAFLNSFEYEHALPIGKLDIEDKEPTLVSRLRIADEAILILREKKLEMKMEKIADETDLVLSSESSAEIEDLLSSIAATFTSFKKDDVLKVLYSRLIRNDKHKKDDMTQENKARLMAILNAILKIIDRLKVQKKETEEGEKTEDEIAFEVKMDEDVKLDLLLEKLVECQNKLKKVKKIKA